MSSSHCVVNVPRVNVVVNRIEWSVKGGSGARRIHEGRSQGGGWGQ